MYEAKRYQNQGEQKNFNAIEQDPVQQYASSFGNSFGDIDNVQSSNDVDSIVTPYEYAYQPAAPLQDYQNSYPAYNENGYASTPYNSGAFHVETGVEGFFVPKPHQAVEVIEPRVPSSFSGFSALSTLMPTALRTAASFLGRSVSLIVGALGMVILGGGVTTAICSFTPLCTISFVPLIGVRRNVERVAKEILNPKYAESLQGALDTFTKMQTDMKSAAIKTENEFKSSPTDEMKSVSNDEVKSTLKDNVKPTEDMIKSTAGIQDVVGTDSSKSNVEKIEKTA